MILLAAGIGASLLVFRALSADFLPLRIWCAVWGISALLASPLEWRSALDLSRATAYLLLLTLFLGLGGAVGALTAPGDAPYPAHDAWDAAQPRLRHRNLVIATSLVGFLSVHLLMRDLGLSYSIFLSAGELASAAAGASASRYYDDFNPGRMTRLAMAFIFVSAALAGWYARRSSGRERAATVGLSFTPALLWAIVFTTKATALFWIVFYAASYWGFGREPAAAAPKAVASARSRLVLATLAVLFAAFLFYAQLFRYGGDFSENAGDAANALGVAAVGHVYAFRQWFDTYGNPWPEQWGARSFAGVYEALGYLEREFGLYGADNVQVGPSETNVYSAIRNITEDLGIIGALLFFLILGAAGARLQARRRRSAMSAAALTAMLAWLMWSPITSLFNYNVLIFGMAGLLALSFHRRIGSHGSHAEADSARLRQLPLR